MSAEDEPTDPAGIDFTQPALALDGTHDGRGQTRKFNVSVGGGDLSTAEAALLAYLTGDVVLHAEQYAHGRRCLRIVHGHVATSRERAALTRLNRLAPAAALAIGGEEEQFVTAIFTDAETVIWWSSSSQVCADDVVDDFADRIIGWCPRAWRFSTDPGTPGAASP